MRAEQDRRQSRRSAGWGGSVEARELPIPRGREVAAAPKELEPERELEAHLRELWLLVPNIPDASRYQKGRARTITSSSSGSSRHMLRLRAAGPCHVADAGRTWLDIERAVKVRRVAELYPQGRRRAAGAGADAVRARPLVRRGFPPLRSRRWRRNSVFVGNSSVPARPRAATSLAADDLSLVGTAEVSITGMHCGEILLVRRSCPFAM